MSPAYNEHLQLFLPTHSNDFVQKDGGSLQPFSKREIPSRLDLFRLTPPPDQPWTIHLRIVSKRTILTHLVIWQPDSQKEFAIAQALGHGAYFGIVLLIACINILYWLRLERSLYLYYSCYVLALAFVFIDFNGYLHQFFVTDRTWLLSPIVRLNLILLMISNIGVLSQLTDLKRQFPLIHKLYCGCFSGIAVIFTLLTLAGMSDTIVMPVLATLLASACVSVAVSLYLVTRRVPGAALYLAAFGALIITGCAKIFAFFDIAPEIFPVNLFWLSTLVHIIIMHVAVTNHVTRYRHEKQKVEADLVAERANVEQQRQFLRLISHELRTPLAIIDSTAQILPILFNDRAKFEKKSATILDATQRMKALLDNCLTDDRLSSDRMVPVMQAIDFQTLARRTIESVQARSDFHKINFETQNLPESFICDPVLIEILICNLLDNAIKYSPNGDVINLRSWTGRHGDLFLEVQDRGVGIPSGHTGKIFEKYYRSGQVSGISGAGLGLYLVQQIAKLHGGEATCTSEPGQGSTFTVRLNPSSI